MIQNLLQKFPDFLFPHVGEQLVQEAIRGRNIFLRISALSTLNTGLKYLAGNQAAAELARDGFIEKAVEAILDLVQEADKVKSKKTLEAIQAAHDFIQRIVQNLTSVKV